MKNEFSDALKKNSEIGYVEEIHSSVIKVSGLPHAHLEEVLLFENGGRGFVYSIDETSIDVLLTNNSSVSISEKVARTGESLSLDVSPDMLGHAYDVLGNPFIGHTKSTKESIKQPLFGSVPGIFSRAPVKDPFLTGISIVDIAIPLGKGQRELVLGDRKTGKTQFLLHILRSQKNTDTVCIYCAIGKREVEIYELIEELQNDVYGKSVIVFASSGHEGVGRIYLTPFSAMAAAEYFRNLGKDVLVILDDLSTHAQFYREMALLSRRFPGRSSYPGDIFHLHAKLLERAGAFHMSNGKQSTITCLPVAQSTLGDITGYITTNLMSMTDGHLYLDSEIFDEGRRPALNPFLSVTRVGHETQFPVIKDLSREVSSFLVSYRRALEFSHFGSEATTAIKDTLSRGGLIYALFDQNSDTLIPIHISLFVLAHIWAGSFKSMDSGEMKQKVQNIIKRMQNDSGYKASIDKLLSFPDFKSVIAQVPSIPLQ